MNPEELEEQRQRLLAAVLRHVPFDGWTTKAMQAGARDLGLPAAEAYRLFPRGPVEAVAAFNAAADRAMAEAMAALPAETNTPGRLRAGILARLAWAEPHIEAVRRGLQLLALPLNAATGLRCLHRTVDTLWYEAGDRATDFNYYTKRALLGGIFGATVLFWINDRSENRAGTAAFLDRRLADANRLNGLIGQAKSRLPNLPNPLDFLARRGFARPRRRRRDS
jgi:ubiquinone biosynthesis protein COQ9